MANDNEVPKEGSEARKKRVSREECTIKLVPSVAETVETWAWLSTSLRSELQQDLDESTDGQQEGPALRDADIDLSSLRIASSQDVLRAKIDDALAYWDKLAERIPLKRHRPAGLPGKVAGSDDMFLDFDIQEREVPRHPPSGANEVHLYQYYVQRLMCTVPRADWLRARTTEGRVPLRANRVKAHLDAFQSKKPYGDRHLLRERNHACKELHRSFSALEGAAGEVLPGPAAAVAAGDGTAVLGSGVLPESGAAAAAGGGAAGESGSAAKGGGAVTARVTAVPSVETSGSGDSGVGGSGGARPSTGAAVSATAGGGGRIFRCFSGPSRAVVTFALYRSAAKGKGLKLQGLLPEKRLFEVEALEQNTLQQIMEVMPPCLADRILEEYRAGGRDDNRDSGASRRAPSGRKCISLAGGSLFMRGVFYVTRPAEGEDASHAPLPPPPQPQRTSRTAKRAAAREAAAAKAAAKAAAIAAKKHAKTRKNAASSTHEAPEPPLNHNAETPPGASSPPPAPPTPTPSEPPGPPEPWMKRWLQFGHASWNIDKEELLRLAEKRRRQHEGGQGDGEGGDGGGGGEAQPRRRGRPRGRPRAQGSVPEREKGRKCAQEVEREAEDADQEEEEEERERGPRAPPGGVSAGAVGAAGPGLASASALASRRTAPTGPEGQAAGNGNGKGKEKGKGNGKGKRAARGAAAATEEPKDGEGGEEKESEEEAGGNGTAAGGAPETLAAAGNSAASGTPRKRKRPGADKLSAGDKDRSKTRTAKGKGAASADAGLTARSMLGVCMKRKLGIGADGGKVVWASDATVGDLRPVLGERYMFVHNRVCDHLFVVSDMRMEPVPASAPPGHPVAATAAAAATATTAIPSVTGTPTLEYPRLSFRTKPNSRRCGVCHTKTAVKTSIGHPLSDKAPMVCCEECFEMLYYDADQKPLEGELAGEAPSVSSPRDRNAEQLGQNVGGHVVGGPRGWKVFGCYDEY
eukprot:g18277.t1